MLPEPVTQAINQKWPLMSHNIAREDLDAVIDHLRQDDPILTQSREVEAFEQEWSEWLGMRHSVFVNSGSSANLLTLAALKIETGPGEIIVPSLTWVSDIASVLQCGFEPIFVDINPETLGMDSDLIIDRLTERTRAVFLSHILGYNALDDRLINTLKDRGIPLIEDVCESHGATHKGKKVGTFGLMSNFSFYYAHHLSTIEGGMISTDNTDYYERLRMLRSHGMVREMKSDMLKADYAARYPDLNPEFIFAFPAYNVRNTEIGAIIGRSQLKRLDDQNLRRSRNLSLFIAGLDPDKYRTDFRMEGQCNYALTLVLKAPDPVLCDRVTEALDAHQIEYRRGTSGGGNQLRQPYLRKIYGDDIHSLYPETDHIHFYGFYIGNYPNLDQDRIIDLCALLNAL